MMKAGPVRLVMILPVAAVLLGGLAPAMSAAQAVQAPASTAFSAFLASLWPEAQGRGVTRETFDKALAGVAPDPSVAVMTRKQPEELKPVGAYLGAQVTSGRIAAGKAVLARWSADLDAMERRYGVPREIVVAIFGMETNYGTSTGNKDVVRSLATLAAMDYRPELYRAELLSALAMLQSGDVAREKMRGSWAGAMGLPQFMPSSYATYAVDGNGDGRRDIWGNVPDALASIANFLRQQGWQPGQPWGCEVKLPAGLDLGRSRASYADWAAAGVMRADKAPMPASGDAILLFPAGAKGPAFLVTENYEVVKTYNFSDVYVLGVGLLADRIAGGSPLQAPWPDDPPISRDDRVALQARLAALGYAVDNRAGRISLALRDLIRAAQTSVGLVPDGNPTKTLLDALPKTPAAP